MRLLSISFLALSACGGSISIVKFSTWGEDFIEKSIPADKFEDGWSAKFDKFLVIIKEAAVVDAAGTVASQQPGAKAYNLTKPGPVELYAATAEAKAYPIVRFGIGPDTGATAGNIDEPDLSLLKSRAASVIVVGKLTKGSDTKTFDWTFASNTLYDECKAADGKPGVTLLPSKEVAVQLTVHGDHFFYDQLSGDAKLRGDPLANADINADNKVTLDELAAVQLSALPAGQYGTTGAANVRTLKDFISQNVRTIGHFQGEGECTPKAR
jgi:hypothetical protein